MKILHTVQNYPPSIGGMQEAVRRISEELSRRGHEVHVATSPHPGRNVWETGGVAIHEFDIKGNLVFGMQGDLGRYQDFVINGNFDVVANFAAQQWATDAILPVLAQVRGLKVFVPTGFSGLHWPEYAGYFRQMPGWMRLYDLHVFLSDRYRDIRFAREHSIGNLTVIPNGADREEFLAENFPDIRAKLGIPRDHFLVVHVGAHTGLKGHAEAISIFARANIRHATFLLIGDAGNPGCSAACRRRERLFQIDPRHYLMDKRFLQAILSREETVAAMVAADLFLFPSRIECSPLVLFECLAAKTPFLTTDAGNAAEIIDWSSGGRLLPTRHTSDGLCRAVISAGAACLKELWCAPNIRTAMAETGHKAWLERFTWEHIAGRYEEAYLNGLCHQQTRSASEGSQGRAT